MLKWIVSVLAGLGLTVYAGGYTGMGPDMTAALAQFAAIGFDATPDELRGNHFAVIGVKDAAPGSAAAVIHPDDAFLRVSLNRDRRPLAAAVDWLRVE